MNQLKLLLESLQTRLQQLKDGASYKELTHHKYCAVCKVNRKCKTCIADSAECGAYMTKVQSMVLRKMTRENVIEWVEEQIVQVKERLKNEP